MRTAIEWHAEACRVGDATAADVIGRLDHEIAPAGRSEPPCSGDSRGAGADNDHIKRAAGRRDRGECRTRGERGRGRKKRTAAQRRHTFHYTCGQCLDVVGSPQRPRTLPQPPPRGKCFGLIGRRQSRAAMLDDAIKAITQLFSPPLRAVLWKSIGLALALIVVVGIVFERLIMHFVDAGSASAEASLGASAHWPVSALAWLLSIAAGLGIIVGS